MNKLSPKKANIFSLLMLIWTFVFSIIIGVISLFISIDPERFELLLITVQDLFLILIPIIFYCIITKTKITEIIPSTPLSIKNVIYVFALTLLMYPIIIFVSNLTNIFYSSYDNNAIIFGYIDKLPMALCVLSLAIMPAVFEELAFRGIVLSNYKSIGIIKAALISAFFFGLFHMDFYQIPYAIVAGVFFALLVSYTNSIYASMLAHFIINGTQVINSKMMFSANSDYLNEALEAIKSSTIEVNIMTSIMSLVICLVVMPLLIGLFKKFKEYNAENHMEYMHYKKDDVYYIDTTENKKVKIFSFSFWSYVIISVLISFVIAKLQ